MDAKEFQDWTPEELLAELRRRERSAPAAGGERGGGVRPSPGHRRELAGLSTPELSTLVRARQRVVYGVDNRQDLYQVTKASVKKAAASIVALVEADDLVAAAGGGYRLRTESYQQSYDLCGSEPFVSQPIGCFCSGFLVAPDVIATAGHCVKSQADLGHIRFVFGFRMEDASTARTTFPRDDVYAGARLLGRRLAADGTDWALVRLDRPVVGRTPLAVRTSGKVKDDQTLFVIGHPCGLPQKYAPGAKVRDNAPSPFFVANLDTYGGNSGSAVFNAQTTVVEGILVRGENDFATNGTCNVSLVCPTTGCRGEDVTRAPVWAARVPVTSPRSKGVPRAPAGAAPRTRAGAGRARGPARSAARRRRGTRPPRRG
jgi:hypothetical protein